MRSVLPANAQVRTAAQQAAEDAKDTNSFVSFLRGFLLAFGGIALFVGSFVIANSLSITIAQRAREFATYRTMGATRLQVLRAIVAEALVIGTAASVVGVFLGLGLAKGLFRLFDAVGFTLPNSGIIFATRTAIVSMIVGVVVTLVASLRPAIRATRVPPIAAVREGATLPPSRFARFRTSVAIAHGGRVRGAPLRAVRQAPRDDGRPDLDGRRRAADLRRRRDVSSRCAVVMAVGWRVRPSPAGLPRCSVFVFIIPSFFFFFFFFLPARRSSPRPGSLRSSMACSASTSGPRAS